MQGRRVKSARQGSIRELLETKEIRTQEQLAAELRHLHFPVTQATLSRDMREMGIVKARRGLGKFVYKIGSDEYPASERDLRVKFVNLVREIKHTGNMILLRTPPGEAQGVARVIDIATIKNVLGTVAGDDTILVVVDKHTNTRKVLDIFSKALKTD
jgi:transcriptional regulator of arginine metabolism